MAVYTSKHITSVVLKDATGSPITYTVSPTPMDLTLGEWEQNGCEYLKVMNNGVYFEGVEGDQIELPWSITIYQDGKLVDGSTGKPFNFVTKAGTVSAGVTGDPGGTGAPWTINQVVITETRNAVTTTITLTNSRVKASYTADKNGNQIKLSGIAYGTGSTLALVIS